MDLLTEEADVKIDKIFQLLISEPEEFQQSAYLLDLFDIGLFVMNLEGKLIYKNKTFIELMKNSGPLENFYDLLATPHKNDILEILEGEKVYIGEVTWNTKFQKKYGDLRLKLGLGIDKKLVIANLRDITHRKHNEKQRQYLISNKLQELESIQNLLMQTTKIATIGKLSLELNQELLFPLNELEKRYTILNKLFIDSELQNTNFFKNIQDIKSLVNQMRDTIEKINSKQNTTNEVLSFNSNEVILNAINYFSEKSQRQKIKLSVNLESNFNLVCEYDKFECVLINLIQNAFDSLEKSDVENKEIRISSIEDSNHKHIIVEDNGDGIPDNIKEKIFEPYFTTKQNGSSGIGLALSVKYIRSLKGDIFVHQIKDLTRFQVSIPKSHYKE